MAKVAIVGIVGRTNAGKSTLVNRLVGEKVSIVSPVEQTTRNTVRGIVADCPYSSAEVMIRKTAAELGYPEGLAFPFIRLGGRIFGGFDVCERTPLEAAKRARLPLLLIHGEADGFVPCEMSKSIASAWGGEVRLEIFEGADHGRSFLADTKRYLAVLREFYEKTL